MTECQEMTKSAIPYSIITVPNVIIVLEYSSDSNPGLMQPAELPEKASVLCWETSAHSAHI